MNHSPEFLSMLAKVPKYVMLRVDAETVNMQPIPQAVREAMANNMIQYRFNSNNDEINPFELWLLSQSPERSKWGI